MLNEFKLISIKIMMKLHSIICIIFPILFLTSSSNDNMTILNNNDLLGVWNLTSITLTTPLDINNDGETSLNVLDEVSIIDATLIFTDSINGTIFYDSSVSFYTRKEIGKLVFMITSSTGSENSPLPFTYTNTDNNVIINQDITFNQTNNNPSVLTLNQNSLSMEVTNGFVVKDINTFEESVSQDITYVFTRQ